MNVLYATTKEGKTHKAAETQNIKVKQEKASQSNMGWHSDR